MGDANTPLTPAEARHLLRRTGLGLTKRDRRTAARIRKTRGELADKILRGRAKQVKYKGDDFGNAVDTWILHMWKTKAPLAEKLVLFWHDHFATAFSTVGRTGLMTQQNQLLRDHAKGNFKEFVKAINRNPAMMEFLDTVRNRRQNPNENYARELCELFTLGVKDLAGNDNYTQDDVVQIARAFTGWRYEVPVKKEVELFDRAEAYFDENRHDFAADYPERGPKVIFTSTGGFGPGGMSFAANGEGPAEIDTVIDILFEHRDSDGQKTVARRIAYRLLEFFAHASPATAVVDQVIAASGFDVNWNVEALLRAIFVHDAFYETAAAAPFDAVTAKSVRWPVDLVLGTIRAFDMKLKVIEERGLRIEGGSEREIHEHIEEMGQELMNPPSVFGWDWETAWVSSATLLARYRFARDIAAAGGKGPNVVVPKKAFNLKLTDPGAIVDEALALFGLDDQLTAAERDFLVDYLTEGGTVTSIDFKNDEDAVEEKLRGLFTLVLQAPAYQVN